MSVVNLESAINKRLDYHYSVYEHKLITMDGLLYVRSFIVIKNQYPKYIRPSSGKAVWWKCKNGHKWKAQVNMRTSGRGCPYCSGKTPVHASLI